MSGDRSGANRFATAVVTILDGTGNPVEGAAVYGTWSGDYSGPAEGFTTTDGTVTFTSGEVKMKNATFTFTVSDVVRDGLNYDPDLNIETEDTIIVP